jgi:hypothetical protein
MVPSFRSEAMLSADVDTMVSRLDVQGRAGISRITH